MRKIIAALQMSLDGRIEGPQGELDWVDAWDDRYGLTDRIDACLLGGGMYPGYEGYWSAVQNDPAGVLAFSGRAPTPNEVEYARFAASTEHIVLSRTLGQATWPHTRIVRDIADIRALKSRPGRDLYAVGGASFVSSLMNADLVDELCLVVSPIVLGPGKPLFGGVSGRHRLRLLEAQPIGDDLLRLSYAVTS
ncbi:dihydrofolate reductase family protein [Lysobacter sp. Root983]|uniref:dihydrofolate reductase family protein n=1 Tax=Lysobacter sp. Root983 TaxID=1736613 RepID=UPI0007094BC1|nr:dihydrofolate reductase family protein [Lysobacter sp. Root983]KRD75912.1 dihydrofolate reductase [Lysobacter sp. Root983]